MGMSFVVSEEAWNGLISGKLVRVPGGIHELSFGKIPKAACDALEKLAGIGNILVMGFSKKGELYGSATIIMRKGCELKNLDIVETFLRQAGVALQHKQAEEALKQSEREYRGLFESAHDAIIIFTPEGEIILDANQRACNIYGFDRSEFVGMSLEKISKDIPRGKREIQATLNKGFYHNFETVQYRKDGTEIFLDINGSVIDYKGNRAILSINRDITERKQVEEALKQSEERLKRAQVIAHLGNWEWNIKENTLSWSDEIYRIFSVS